MSIMRMNEGYYAMKFKPEHKYYNVFRIIGYTKTGRARIEEWIEPYKECNENWICKKPITRIICAGKMEIMKGHSKYQNYYFDFKEAIHFKNLDEWEDKVECEGELIM